MADLKYSPRSGHVTLDGAVIGSIDGLNWKSFVPGRPALQAATLPELLAKIRDQVEKLTNGDQRKK